MPAQGAYRQGRWRWLIASTLLILELEVLVTFMVAGDEAAVGPDSLVTTEWHVGRAHGDRRSGNRAMLQESTTGDEKAGGGGLNDLAHGAGSRFFQPVFEDLASLYRATREPLPHANVDYLSRTPQAARCDFQGPGPSCGESEPAASISFLVTEKPYTREEAEAFSDHTAFPVFEAPLAIVYNIPELDGHQFTLQLDVETVGRIYSGLITNWKDPDILVHNPGLQDVLPDHNILVVAHIGSGGENFIFKSSMNESYAHYEEQLQDDTLEKGGPLGWPMGNGTFSYRSSSAGISYAVLTSPYTIGYSAYATASELGLPQAGISNGRNYVALSTIAGVCGSSGLQAHQDAADGGSTEWPFKGRVEVVVRNNTVPQDLTCAEVAGGHQFILWLMASDNAQRVLEEHGFLQLPELTRATLRAKFLTMVCDGQQLTTPADLLGDFDRVLLLSHSDARVARFLASHYLRYELLTSAVRVSAVVGVAAGAPCSAPLEPQEGFRVARCVWGEAAPAGAVMIPWLVSALVVRANLPGLNTQSLHMDVDTLTALITRDITRWDDSRLVALNPALVGVEESVTVLVAADMVGVVQQLLLPPDTTAPPLLTTALADTDVDGTAMLARFEDLPHSLIFTSDLSAVHGAAEAGFTVHVDSVAPSPDSIQSCMLEEEFGIDIGREGCYPLTAPVHAILRDKHTQEQDAIAIAEVLLWSWMIHGGHSLPPSSSALLSAYDSASTTVQSEIDARLGSIAFHNGSSVLASLAGPGPESQRSVIIAVIISCGGVLLLLVLLLVYMYQRHLRVLRQVHALDTEEQEQGMQEDISVDSPVIKIMKFLEGIVNAEKSSVDKEQAAELLKMLHVSNNLQAPDIYSEVDKLHNRHAETIAKGAIGEYLVELAMPNARASVHLNPSARGSQQESRLSGRMFSDASLSLSQPSSDRDLLHGDDTAGLLKSLAEILGEDSAVTPKRLAQAMSPLGSSLFCNVTHLVDLTRNRPLSAVVMYALHAENLVTGLALDRRKLVTYIMAIEDGYNANSYHNRSHAADVTARSYAILKRIGMSNQLDSNLHKLAALLAAAAHDTQHPGFNNAFVVRNEGPLSRKYNDQAVLENHSLHVSLELIREPGMNFLRGSLIGTGHFWRQFKAQMINMVLATDMSNHFEIVSKFQQKFASLKYSDTPNAYEEDGSMVNVLLQMVIKSADIGHCATRMQQHLFWSKTLEEEFFSQGDVERMNQQDVSAMMDRDKPGAMNPSNQVGFFEVIVLPLYKAMVEFFPLTSPLYEQATTNYNYWKQHLEPGWAFAARPAAEYKEIMWEGFDKGRGTLDDGVTEMDHIGQRMSSLFKVTGVNSSSGSVPMSQRRMIASEARGRKSSNT